MAERMTLARAAALLFAAACTSTHLVGTRPHPACGGVNDFSCPAPWVCVDDPDDSCIPSALNPDCPTYCDSPPDVRFGEDAGVEPRPDGSP